MFDNFRNHDLRSYFSQAEIKLFSHAYFINYKSYYPKINLNTHLDTGINFELNSELAMIDSGLGDHIFTP